MQQVEEFQEVRRIPEVPKLAEHEDEPQMFQEVKFLNFKVFLLK